MSTVDDYPAFGRILLNRGRHGGERILSRPSVEALTTDQRRRGRGSRTLRLGRRPRHLLTEDLVGILMTQGMWTSPRGPGVYHDFWTQAYQAIDD